MQIYKKDIAAYVLLPQVFPRFKDLFASGFGWFAALVAYIYYSVRLLPAGHPCLRPENKGKFGLRHVIAAAAQNLKFDLRHIDQILIFATVIAGVFLLIGQVVLLVFGFLFTQAEASGVFQTANPQTDNAFMMLDYVFGIPGFFGSCALGTPSGSGIAPCTAIPAFGAAPVYAFHAGLHTLLEFYSWSLLFVAVLIFLYFFVVVMAETASTGVPFGARFNSAWAPIRLIVAIGLLIPVAYGLNSGQYLTLAIAKLGSGLATNGWLAYNDTVIAQKYDYPNPIGMNPGGNGGNAPLLPKPEVPDISGYMAAMQLVKACQYGYMKRYGWGVKVGGAFLEDPIRPYAYKVGAKPYQLLDDSGKYLDQTGKVISGADNQVKAYKEVLEYFDYGDIVITYGRGSSTTSIIPYCGTITVPTTTAVEIKNDKGDPAGAWDVQIQYYAMTMFEWDSNQNRAFAARYGESKLTGMPALYRPCMIKPGHLDGGMTLDLDTVLTETKHHYDPSDPECALSTFANPPSLAERSALYSTREGQLDGQIKSAWIKMRTVKDLYELTDAVRKRGWAAAGMWYNQLAFVIGREFDAAHSLPYMSKFPLVMEKVKSIKGGENINIPGAEIYNPVVGNSQAIQSSLGEKETEMAKTLYFVYKDWYMAGIGMSSLSVMGDKNFITSAMHGIFGTRTMMSIRDAESAEIHPMAQLVAIGKDLVNSTLMNVLLSTGFAIAGGIFEASGAAYNAGTANAISGALSSIALVGLTAGFLLYYVLPFMPFLYFFFAVGTWVKTIFEAMVGVPLWALAHLRIDREGLPGDAAANGYFLLFEIFIRPILCVFGLIASFIIFGALVRILHEIFDLVVDNAMGFDDKNLHVDLGVYTLTLENKRAIIDQFFFTIIYVLMVYVIGLSCFKLIDMVPNSILRWAGAGVRSFGDTYQDPAEGLTQYAAVGGYVVGERAIGGIRQAGGVVGQGIGAMDKSIAEKIEFPWLSGEMKMVQARNAAKKGSE
ncbi:MAG: DotA/TraY family protein [Rhodospirillales bacterium]|nr:DotA/TraY family protein [Rhodospirillales bacterium]MCB9964592.1 DotA/TraY family protein [Rhodospirillales bacterium]MCB9980510.1 DotA/TraY family protein [Rhodospirillales bacterium]